MRPRHKIILHCVDSDRLSRYRLVLEARLHVKVSSYETQQEVRDALAERYQGAPLVRCLVLVSSRRGVWNKELRSLASISPVPVLLIDLHGAFTALPLHAHQVLGNWADMATVIDALHRMMARKPGPARQIERKTVAA